MKLSFGLHMQQTQRLVMTPELRQAIAVLQLPVTELEEYLEQELLENPVLEVEQKEEPEAVGEEPLIDPTRLLDYIGDEGTGSGLVQEQDSAFEPIVTPAVSLHEHLLEQLRMATVPAAVCRITEFLIGNIDDRGYLTIGVQETAEALSAPEGDVEAALALLQSFDPVGVGARDLRECLHLQRLALAENDPLVEAIIDHHLDDLAAGRMMRVADALGEKPARIQEAIDLIRKLDPKPGRRFGRAGETRYIVPDVAIERVLGDYAIFVNEGPIPRLGISQHYRSMLQGTLDAETRRFLEGKIQSALWLMKSLEQRRQTLYKVTEAVLRFQREFMERGARCLRPLTLREVADVVGLHESTVSRATSGKYVQTPQGLFELKYFFSSGVESVGGDALASGSVKKMIGDLIQQENPHTPLSDQDLTEALDKQGVRISRRTVAKYREEMGIPSSTKRKRY